MTVQDLKLWQEMSLCVTAVSSILHHLYVSDFVQGPRIPGGNCCHYSQESVVPRVM